MSEDQKNDLLKFCDELNHNRDYYSRSKIIELIKEKIKTKIK